MRVFGRRWFSVDYKSFELEEVGEGRKAQVFITERRRGRSSWIRFGKEGVKILTKGVESFRRGAGWKSEGLEWWENERRYSLKLKENAGGRFLLCSVADLDGKWHVLAFPEGNGLINGWSLLVEALQDLRTMEDKGEYSRPAKSTAQSKTEKHKGGINQNLARGETKIQEKENQDSIWMDISESLSKGSLRVLKNGMVGGWKSHQKVELSLTELEVWAKRAWRLKGRVQFQQLNQNLFFLDFDLVEEAFWVMENGSRICRGEAMFLEWWSPSTGCKGRTEENQEVWIRVVGLPLHMWTEEILITVGNGCGGFVAMDKVTEQREDLRWARILVKKDRTVKPSSVNLLAGARSYELQIWWEIQPTVMEVYPRGCRTKDFSASSSGEDDGKPRASGRVNVAKAIPSHASREWQRDLGDLGVLEKRGTGGGVHKCPMSAGNYRVGPKQCVGIQNNMGISGREEGAKQFISSDSKKGGLGCQTGKMAAQIQSPSLAKRAAQNQSSNLGTTTGQSPSRIWNTARPMAGNALDDEREKRKGLGGGKKEGAENDCRVSLQRSGASVGEEKEPHEKTPTQTAGQKEINISAWGTSREEGRNSREAKGKNEEKRSSFMGSDRDSFSGEFLRDTLSFSVGRVGGVEEMSTDEEKRQRPLQVGDIKLS